MTLRGTRRHSEGFQRALRGTEEHSHKCRKQSEAIIGNQRQSEAIRRAFSQVSEAIRGNQRQSEAIRGNQKSILSQVSEARSERLGPVAKFGHAHCMHGPTDIVLPHAAQPDGGGDAEQA